MVHRRGGEAEEDDRDGDEAISGTLESRRSRRSEGQIISNPRFPSLSLAHSLSRALSRSGSKPGDRAFIGEIRSEPLQLIKVRSRDGIYLSDGIV